MPNYFGLLHGLGFASAFSEMDLYSAHQLATLADFNVGVEIERVLFLLAVEGHVHHTTDTN
ncbi:MAG: HupE/UreJ family protein [Steroidobacteraceae bacterium]